MTIATFNSGRRLGAGLIGLALALPSIAQDAQVEALAKQADAIAVVEMAFVPYGNLVLLREMLQGSRDGMPDAGELIGPCLPGKAQLRALTENSPDPAVSAVWHAAVEQAGYTSVLFLKRQAGMLSGLCGETLTFENWLMHPRHGVWRTRLDAWLQDQAAR